MPTIGWYDPDEDEGNERKYQAWQIPKTNLLISAMSASGRKYLKSREEQRRWKFIEEKTLGSTEYQIMFEAWVRHNIELNVSANTRSLTRSFAALMTMIENREREVDWIIANKEEVMKSRAQSIKSILETGVIKHGRSNTAK